MSTRKTTLFYALLIAVASMAVGMVLASRLDLTPPSSAQSIAIPPMNSAPLTGALDAQTFRTIAKAQTPMVVSIRTEMNARNEMTDFFGGGNSPEDFFHRFFGQPPGQGQGQGQDEDQPRGGRRRHQPRQLGRSAAERARRGDRDEHHDHQRLQVRGQSGDRVRGAEQHDPGSLAAASDRQGDARPDWRLGDAGAARRLPGVRLE